MLTFIFSCILVTLLIVSVYKPIFVLKFLIIFVMLQYFLTQQLGLPERLTLTDDVTFYILLFVTLFRKQNLFKLKKDIFFVVVAIALTGIFSGFVNGSHFYVTLLGLRGYLQYILLFFLIVNLNITRDEVNRLTTFFIDTFLVLNIPLMLYQIAEVTFITHWWQPDTVKGSFGAGGSNMLTYVAILPLFFIFGRIIEEKNMSKKNILRLIMISIIFIFSQGRYGIILTPLVFLWIYKTKLIFKKRLFKYTILIFSVLIILFFSFFVIGEMFSGLHISEGFAGLRYYNIYKNFVDWEFNVDMGANRYLWLELVWNYVKKSFTHILVGYGPGEFWSYISYKLKSRITMETFNYWGQLEMGHDAGCACGLVPVIGEFGFLGLFLFWYMYYKIYKFSWKVYKYSFTPELKTFCLAVIAGSIMMFFGVYVQLIWEHQNTVFFYWFFTAMFYKMYLETIEKVNLPQRH
ncbi:MAG: hypothetical protein AB1349_01885 [Elusimicrobiota bacterium]